MPCRRKKQIHAYIITNVKYIQMNLFTRTLILFIRYQDFLRSSGQAIKCLKRWYLETIKKLLKMIDCKKTDFNILTLNKVIKFWLI